MGRLTVGGLKRFFPARGVAAAVGVTALSIALFGGIVLVETPLGCGPARMVGIKGITSHCPVLSAAKPTPSPTATPSTFPSSPSPSPTPTPLQSPTPTLPDEGPATSAYPPIFAPVTGEGQQPRFAVNCSLPVYADTPGSGGFLTFPGVTYIADPRSSVTVPGTGTPSPSPSPSPVGPGPVTYPGWFGLTFDRQYSRWVPVPQGWLSSDGRHYAYPSFNSIFAVDVTNDKPIELGVGQRWNIVGVSADGVYADKSGSAGLWLLAFSGAAKQITETGYWQAASGGAAYGPLSSAVLPGATNPIQKLDLSTGNITPWFTRTATQGNVVGFDADGHPIISVVYNNLSSGVTEYWVAYGPGNADVITGMPRGLSIKSLAADSRGIWLMGTYSYYYNFGYGNGLYLYVRGSGIYWMAGVYGNLAGGCGS